MSARTSAQIFGVSICLVRDRETLVDTQLCTHEIEQQLVCAKKSREIEIRINKSKAHLLSGSRCAPEPDTIKIFTCGNSESYQLIFTNNISSTYSFGFFFEFKKSARTHTLAERESWISTEELWGTDLLGIMWKAEGGPRRDRECQL